MSNKSTYQWAIIGAGPAGIAVVGKLIDAGVPAGEIIWFDPQFKVGDLGQYWRHVSSNTTVRRFLDFLRASVAFGYDKAPANFELNHLPLDKTCILSDVVQPLQWVTENLQKQVHSVCALVQKLALTNRQWQLKTENASFQADNVVLATGAEPLQLNYPIHDSVNHQGVAVLSLATALDREKLTQVVNKKQTYAVFGSSHSAMIVIRSLVELGVQKIINFYRSPCCYAIDQGDWILFDNTGLKGETAAWTREHIDGVLPSNLVRYLSNETNLARFLPECQHVIYAVGFAPRYSFYIEGYQHVMHNPHNGIIGPGLFGFGLGFPELAVDPLGHEESQVGLWKFMVYLNKVLPIWQSYSV